MEGNYTLKLQNYMVKENISLVTGWTFKHWAEDQLSIDTFDYTLSQLPPRTVSETIKLKEFGGKILIPLLNLSQFELNTKIVIIVC